MDGPYSREIPNLAFITTAQFWAFSDPSPCSFADVIYGWSLIYVFEFLIWKTFCHLDALRLAQMRKSFLDQMAFFIQLANGFL